MSKLCISFSLVATAALVPLVASADAWVVTSVGSPELVGETHIVKAGLVARTALKSFSLEFKNGDHKIRKLGLLPSIDRVDVAMADVDGADPYKFNAQFMKIPWSGSSTRVSKSCNGACSLEIKHPISSNDKMHQQIFVLRGFHFERDSKDFNVRRISIRANVASKKIDVVYQDNTASKFTVTVDYTLLHKDLLKPAASASGQRKAGEATLKVKTPGAPAGLAILSGFDIQFDNGDHHLKQFAIKRVTGAYNVVFNDQNTDDPYRVTIDYAGIIQ